jgi:hypothetical protein
MKKLLVLAVIMSIATMSSAMSLNLLANGLDVSKITINPGDTVALSINASGFAQGEGMTWGVVIYTPGTISGGALTAAVPDNCWVSTSADAADWTALFAGVTSGAYGGIDTWSVSPTYSKAGGVYVDSMSYVGGATVIQLGTITFAEDGAALFAPVDTLTVDVPEPATMVILALGGLLFRRK